MDEANQESQSRQPVYLHWCPEPVEEKPITACGLNIDQPKALAWTRSRNLKDYQNRPYEKWPKPCPICLPVSLDTPPPEP